MTTRKVSKRHRSARVIFRVTYSKTDGFWSVTREKVAIADRNLKSQAVTLGRLEAKKSMPSQLVIHKKDGRIETEHTYPRSSDPRVTKG